MFLWFVKPKGRKTYRHYTEITQAKKMYDYFFFVKFFSYMSWFVCLPFLVLAYKETVKVFLLLTIICIVTDLISKAMHPKYKYF